MKEFNAIIWSGYGIVLNIPPENLIKELQNIYEMLDRKLSLDTRKENKQEN